MSGVDDLREWVRAHPWHDFSPTNRQRINLVAHNAHIDFPSKHLSDEQAAEKILKALVKEYGE